MNWIVLAQAIPDAKELADGDAQKVLAYVVAALVLAVLGLFAMLTKVVVSHRNEIKEIYQAHETKMDDLAAGHKQEVEGLHEKNDKLQERLLRYIANVNKILSGNSAPATGSDPLDPTGGGL